MFCACPNFFLDRDTKSYAINLSFSDFSDFDNGSGNLYYKLPSFASKTTANIRIDDRENCVPILVQINQSTKVTECAKIIDDSARSVADPDSGSDSPKTEQYWIEDQKNNFFRLTQALCAAENRYCRIMVVTDYFLDDRDYASADSAKKSRSVTKKQAEQLAEAFASVYPLVTEIFGTEKTSDWAVSKQNNPNFITVEDDDRIDLLLYGFSDFSEPESTIVGFFRPVDILKNYISAQGISNNRAMFYIDSSFLNSSPKLLVSTLVHEFQHLLNTVHQETNEAVEVWYQEMMSMQAEDLLVEYFKELVPGYDEALHSPKNRIPLIDLLYPFVGIGEWRDGDPLLPDDESSDLGICSYAQLYTFGSFLARNYGGAKLIQTMAKSGRVNEDAINYALNKSGYNQNFQGVVEEYVLSFGQKRATSRTLLKAADSHDISAQYTRADGTTGIYTFPQNPVSLWIEAPKAYESEETRYLAAPTYYLKPATEEIRPYGFLMDGLQIQKDNSVEFTLQIPGNSSVEYFILMIRPSSE